MTGNLFMRYVSLYQAIRFSTVERKSLIVKLLIGSTQVPVEERCRGLPIKYFNLKLE
jgi:hypothetical protein